MSSQLKLEKVRRETGGDEPSSDQIFPVTGSKVAAVCRGRGLSSSAYALSSIRKDLVVMS
jgi:hypothetical protein